MNMLTVPIISVQKFQIYHISGFRIDKNKGYKLLGGKLQVMNVGGAHK